MQAPGRSQWQIEINFSQMSFSIDPVLETGDGGRIVVYDLNQKPFNSKIFQHKLSFRCAMECFPSCGKQINFIKRFLLFVFFICHCNCKRAKTILQRRYFEHTRHTPGILYRENNILFSNINDNKISQTNENPSTSPN